MPVDSPDITPDDAPTETILVLPVVHTPPDGVALKVDVLPTQIDGEPPSVGTLFTVAIAVAAQPVSNV